MRKVLLAALALALLVGCGKSASKPSDPPTAIAAIYLTTVQTYTPGSTDTARVQLARQVCALFDQKNSWVQVVNAIMQEGFTATQAGGIVASATPIYCPNHDNALPPG